MVDLAVHDGNGPVLLKDAAARQDVSEKYLSQIVIPLRAAGLLQSTRGPRGGYRLGKASRDITVADIVEALDGSICLVDCLGDQRLCDRIGVCPTREVWKLLGDRVRQTLHGVTLAELSGREREKAQNDSMGHI